MKIQLKKLTVKKVILAIALGIVVYLCETNVGKIRILISPKRYEAEILQKIEESNLLKPMDEPRAFYRFVVQPSLHDLLEAPDDNKGWTSIVLVKSYFGNSDRRAAIRETWGGIQKWAGNRLITIFILARPDDENLLQNVIDEFNAHGDILLVGMEDTSTHVAEKALAGMQWVSDNVPPNWIYSSADDDIALHIPNFIRYIDTTRGKKRETHQCGSQLSNLPIMCIYSFNKYDYPARDPVSKWYMPVSKYPAKIWPTYCRGGWYSMEVEVAQSLYKVSRWIEFLWLDDVWITGLMRIKLLSDTCNSDELMDGMLHAAPLSKRSDYELSHKRHEALETVIVSHIWGNIANRKVNVVEELREFYRRWNFYQSV